MNLHPVIRTRLEKAAVDNGFDQELLPQGDWLLFASSQAPLRLWVSTWGDDRLVAALSQGHVARALGDLGTPFTGELPDGAAAALSSPDIPSLHRLLRRAFQLSKSLPDELLHTFEKESGRLPRSTEAERLVVQRVGQDIFRRGLLDYWEGRCAVTHLAIPDLLRASHIKPWAHCESDAERLDVYNGLLLAPQLDAAFDRGYLTFGDAGELLVSPRLLELEREILGIAVPRRLRSITAAHRHYLAWHRAHVFLAQESHLAEVELSGG